MGPWRFADRYLFIATFFLLITGIIFILSASSGQATAYSWKYSIFINHIIRVIISVFFLLFAFILPSSFWAKYARAGILISIILLFVVLIFGSAPRTSKSYFNLGFLSFQPVELAKLALVIYASDALVRKEDILDDPVKGFTPRLIVFLIVFIFVLLQPDLGSLFAITLIYFLTLFAGGVPVRHLLVTLFVLVSVGIIIGGILFFSAKNSVRITKYISRITDRIKAYPDPFVAPDSAGYQQCQSLIALGSGGFFGVGIGNSRQKLDFLPDAHTDFIFSIIGEETGFFGTLLVILAFVVILFRGFRIVIRAPDKFLKIMAFGLTIIITIYALINVSVSVSLLPVTGLPLPFISYGGTNLLISMISIGILLRISAEIEFDLIKSKNLKENY